ncbi:hypothetical protein A3Q56_07475 [Intoshia linei]|uniref:Uncharacterized protein n=1 Tax=Intoshia linei TaxID=1819745 RepID=A0A177AS45_9BILA|nr:hypothetical protein A3Q56_07475 [Intoshia linei]
MVSQVITSIACAINVDDYSGKNQCIKILETDSKITVSHNGVNSDFSFENQFDVPNNNVKYYNSFHCNVDQFVEGYNVSIISNGRLNINKIKTLYGIPKCKGLANDLVNDLFYKLEQKKNDGIESIVTINFIDILDGDSIYDLINPKDNKIELKNEENYGIYADHSTTLVAKSADELMEYIVNGSLLHISNFPISLGTILSISLETKCKEEKNITTRSNMYIININDYETETLSSTGKDNIKCMNQILKNMSKSNLPFQSSSMGIYLKYILTNHIIVMAPIVINDSNYLSIHFDVDLDKYASSNITTLQTSKAAEGYKCNIKMIKFDLFQLTKNTKTILNERAKHSLQCFSNKIELDTSQETLNKFEKLRDNLLLYKHMYWGKKEFITLMSLEERNANLASKGIFKNMTLEMSFPNKDYETEFVKLNQEKKKLAIDMAELHNKLIKNRKLLEAAVENLRNTDGKISKVNDSVVGNIKKKKTEIDIDTNQLKQYRISLTEIHLKLENIKNNVDYTSLFQENGKLRDILQSENLSKLEKENLEKLEEEVENLKLDIEQSKAELKTKIEGGKVFTNQEIMDLHNELFELRKKEIIDTHQINNLETEKNIIKEALQNLQNDNNNQIINNRNHYFNTFRKFRRQITSLFDSLNQRNKVMLNQVVNDAVQLSNRNDIITNKNKNLQKKISELKDKLSLLEGESHT